MKRAAVLALLSALLLVPITVWPQVTYTWNGATSGSWTQDSSWTPTRSAPAANDILIINTSATLSNVPTQTIGKLTIGANKSVTLNSSGGTLTATNAGIDVQIGAGALLTLGSGLTLVSTNDLVNDGSINGSGGVKIKNKVGTSNSTSICQFWTTVEFASLVGGSCKLESPVEITGSVSVNADANVIPWNSGITLKVIGTLTNNGTIRNDEGGMDVEVVGTLVNNGTIDDDTPTVNVFVTVNGSVVNDGAWSNVTTYLSGTGTLSGGTGFITNLVVKSTGSVTVANSIACYGTLRVQAGGVLSVSSGTILQARKNVTVEKFAGVEGDRDILRNRAQQSARLAGDDGKINGLGTLQFYGYGKTFSNEGDVYAPTVFVQNEGDTKYITGSGGEWTSLTIDPSAHVIIAGFQSFIGSPTPFVVNGVVEFNAGATASYRGSSSQSVAPITYNSLEIYNSAGASLSGDVSVFGQIETPLGNLTTGAYKVTLQSSATMDESGGNVIGAVYTVRACTTGANQSFGGIGIELTTASYTPSVVNVSISRTTGTAPSMSGVKFIKRYYDLSTTAENLSATLVFHYRADELDGATEGRLQLFRSTDEGATWSNVGGVVNTTLHTITLAGVNALSRWAAGTALEGEYCADQNTVLLAHFDESTGSTISDVSGNNHHSTAVGTTIVLGRFGNGRTFNGSSDYSEGASTLFNFGTLPFTVEAWLKPSTSASQAIFTTHNTTTGKYANIGLYIGGAGFVDPDVNNGQGSKTNWAGRSIVDGKWHHVGAVRSGNLAYLYIDGVLDFIDTLSQSPENSNIFRIGSTYPGAYFNGIIDEIRISNIARSPEAFNLQLRPKNLVAAASGGGIGLTWQNGGGSAPLMRYRVYRGLDSSSVMLIDSVTVLSYTNSGMTSGITYYFRVSAVDSTGYESVSSHAASASISTPSPTIISVSPGGGRQGATATVLLTGSNFVDGGTTVSFSGVGIAVTSVTFLSSSQLNVIVSIAEAATLGLRNISVTTAGGTAILGNAFEIQRPAPVLISISPTTGGRGEGITVFLNGTGFVNGTTTASFGDGIAVSAVDGNSTSLAAQITIAQSAALGTRNVTVETPEPGGGSSTLSAAFAVVNPVPVIATIAPSSCMRGKTVNVVVTGSNFYGGVTSISFGAGITVDSVVVLNNTQLQARLSITYEGSSGLRDLTVSNSAPGGGAATLMGAFTVNNAVPKITAVAPSSGQRGKATTVTITGTDLVAGFTTLSAGNGITAGPLTAISATQMTSALVISRSANVGARDLTITTGPPGGGSSTLAAGFTVQNPAPIAASLSPQSGVVGQTLNVVVTGSYFFSGATTADFGAGIAVNSSSVDTSGTRLTANISISGDAVAGNRSITLANPAPGGGTAVLADAFLVGNPVPTLTSVSPASGGKGQTLDVTLAGTGFKTGVTSVDFGVGVTVNSVVVSSPTSLRASVTIDPITLAAARSVSVMNATPGGGKATLSFVFNVVNLAPTITGVSPATGSRGENGVVTITGTSFSVGSTTVDFGAGITVSSATVTSPTQVTANLAVAAGAVLGARNVVVTNAPPGGGSATLVNGYLVGNPVPTIASISPATGSRGQSLTVNVSGTGFFAGATSLSFGAGVDVTSLAVVSPTQLTAAITITTGAPTGARNIEVTNPAPGGGTASLAGGLTVTNPAPTISGITPSNALRGAALSVTVTGTQFLAGVTSLSLGSDITVSGLVVRSLTELQANIAVGSGAPASVKDVTVTNASPGGGSASLSGGFTIANPAPTITSASPASAGRGSIVNVTILGTQFLSGVTTVSFGSDIAITNTTVKSATELMVGISIPLNAAIGTRVVSVTNASPGGGTATLPTGFSVTTSPPTGIEGDLGLVPDQYVLQEAYPNPFNPSTRIRYGIPEDSRVELVIHNMLGNVVGELINGERSKGLYELLWHAGHLPSGVYLIRLQAQSLESPKRFLASRKVVLVK